MKNKICKNCGHIGQPTSQGAGSFFVDAMLWLVFASFTLFSAFLPFMLIPLGWTIFHIITYKSITCPKCENFDMVSLNSKKGKLAQERFHGKSDSISSNSVMPPPLSH